MSQLYCNPKVSKTALNKFLSIFKPGTDELHTFSLYINDECLIRFGIAPYEPTDKREIYSLSKSFCSTAIGMLIDDGKLSLDDKIVDLFPEKCPAEISENLAEMTLKNVLSMNTGHEKCVMPEMSFGEDAVKGFLAQPVKFTPGTHFTYNTGATCLLSCLVTKITGMNLLDFLTLRLFNPLGITDVRWNRVPSGQNEGGCGAHVSNDDIAKLGLLYLHGGVYEGKHLLSEEWVKLASSPISDNSGNGSVHWCSGYGFQFWMNARGGYRGDGACGQLCMILPEYNAVVATQTELNTFHDEIEGIYELLEHIFDEDDETQIIFPEYAPISNEHRPAEFENAVWEFEKNPINWTTLRFVHSENDNVLHAVISDGCDQFDIQAGSGVWIENTVIARRLKPKLVTVMNADEKERCRFVASYTAEENKINMAIRYLNSPHRMAFVFAVDKNGILKMNINPFYLMHDGSRELTAKKAVKATPHNSGVQDA